MKAYILCRFKVRRLEINDFGYLMEHLYGRDGIAYEDYEYQLPKKKLNKETLIKYYDLIRPTRCLIEESQRYLRLEHEDKESYVSYFTVNAIVGELDFPSSEIFYFQQQQFTFHVDTSMNVEIVENRKALTTVRNKNLYESVYEKHDSPNKINIIAHDIRFTYQQKGPINNWAFTLFAQVYCAGSFSILNFIGAEPCYRLHDVYR